MVRRGPGRTRHRVLLEARFAVESLSYRASNLVERHYKVVGEVPYIESEVETKMPGTIDIGSLISRSPSIRQGRPCIAGTGVSVRRIAQWYNLGLNPEEITARIEHLNLAQVHAALAYYHANREEIDDDLAVEEVASDEIERGYRPPRSFSG